jgi:uncharacterized membrane protein YeaQ/YmgE (transglycosylase-associated protein family)
LLILFILVWGMFAGWLAHLILARNEPINWGELLLVGLAGSFVGGLLFSLLTGNGLALRPSGIIGSTLGAIALLAAWRAFRGSGRRHRAR